jgi:hypothetical protein
MKYNIFTVLNEGYEKFGLMFVSSIIDRLDLDFIGSIFLYDTGLSDVTKSKLLGFDKVVIVESGIVTDDTDVLHSETWQKNVYSKAKLLKHCIQNQKNFLPTIMVDADCIFIKEFFDLIDTTKDITACKRSHRGRKEGHQADSSHIGSFFSVNKLNDMTLTFLDTWITKIDEVSGVGREGTYTPKESPALSITYKELSDSVQVSDLPEPVVANIEHLPPDEACILHLKSDFRFKTVESRVYQSRSRYYAKRYFL